MNGVKVLKSSLDRTKPKHPFYVLLPDNISKDIVDELENEKINILYTSPFGNEIMGRDNNVDYWKNTLFKLKIFDLTSFEKNSLFG